MTTTPDRLAKGIRSLGYGVEEIAVIDALRLETTTSVAPLPDDAPAYFRRAFLAAREAHRPILIDFWAEWCPPCVRLKRETFGDPRVARELEGVEVIFVDLDEHPMLAEAYDVSSVPDIFLVDGNGLVTDRLRRFEGPDEFLTRIGLWIEGNTTLGLTTSVPVIEAVRELSLDHRVRILGRLVDSVDPVGPAASAGIVAGDVLLRLDDNDLYSADDIVDFLAVSEPGQIAKLRYMRIGDAEVRELSVILGGDPSAKLSGGLQWQFAGLGQLPDALEQARAEKKKVMVGLSGAET